MTATTSRRVDAAATRRVADVMTRRLVTVGPEDTLLAAWELLSRSDFRHLPVVGNDGRVLAVVDECLLAAEWMSAPLAAGRRRRIGEFMPQRVHCVHVDAPLGRVAEIMAAERATCVPVVDDGMHLVGLVTDVDIVRSVAAEMSR